MRCRFLGVGEAFDELLPNSSILIQSDTSLLLDCGYTVPVNYWRLAEQPLELDAIWISHFHGDHYFGLSALILRMYEEGRRRPLILASQPGLEERLSQCLDLAYPNIRRRMAFDLHFLEAAPSEILNIGDLVLECAQSDHSQPNCAVKVSNGKASIFYSGDGRPTAETLALARGVDMVVHESFALDEDVPGHGTVAGSINFCREAGAGSLALIHIRRDIRHGREKDIRRLMADARDLQVSLPEPGEIYDLG